MAPGKTEILTGTATATGSIFAFVPLADSTFSAITGMTGSVTGVNFPKGVAVYGNFPVITIATGTAIIYYIRP